MPSSQPRVLAVEDDKSTRILLRHILKDFCAPTVVESREEALEATKARSFDLLLLDINLQAEDTAPSVPSGAA